MKPTAENLKLLCDSRDDEKWSEILEELRREAPKAEGTVEAVLTCVTEPDGEQLEGIRAFVRDKCNADRVSIVIKKDASLGGGFKLQAGTLEYDWSTKEKLRCLDKKLTEAAGKAAGSA